MNAFFTTDGEPLQVEVFMEPESIELFNDAMILDGKHSASYSAKGNSFDAGNYFKATKTKTRTTIKKEVELITNSLRRRIDSYMDSENGHMTKALREHIADAICRVVASCQQELSFDIIRHGFQYTGQYPFNFNDKMACCTTNIPLKEMTNMRAKFDQMTNEFKKKGYLTEAEMDEAGIMKVDDDGRKPKDERVAHHNRAMLLNTEANLERFKKNLVPAELSPVNRESYKETIKERNKRERRELAEAL